MKKEIGQRIKDLRAAKGLTLKDVSEKAELSVSFLSLVERGLTSIAITSLKKIADVLDEDLTTFFEQPKKTPKHVTRGYELEVTKIDHSNYIYFSMASGLPGRKLDPMVVHLYPEQDREAVIPYSHQGEEFCYVLEGILTFIIENEEFVLYPGDSLQIHSTTPHIWANFTNQIVKLLYVITPPVFENSKHNNNFEEKNNDK